MGMDRHLHPDVLRRILEQAGPPVQVALPPADDQTEAEFQDEVTRLAKRHGWLAYHTHNSRKSEAGFWDSTLIRGRVLIGAELKVGDNKPTGPQLTWLEALAGVKVVRSTVWKPEMWPEIERILRGNT